MLEAASDAGAIDEIAAVADIPGWPRVYQFNFDFQLTALDVLWSLGWSMIALSALIYLPPAAIAVFGVALAAGHDLLDGVGAASFGVLLPDRSGAADAGRGATAMCNEQSS
jgi:hypothetical protein